MANLSDRLSGRGRRISGVVSTDDIIAGRYKHMYADPARLAEHVFEAFAPELGRSLEPGDILIADSHFGIGSSREQAVSALMAAGVTAVLAPSFGRIFFRNCWNLGLPAFELAVGEVADGDPVELDFAAGSAIIGGRRHSFPPPADEVLQMWRAGGLLASVKAGLGGGSGAG